jgi:hypothetical protein
MTGLIHIGDAAAQVIGRLLAMRTSKSPQSNRLQKDPKMRTDDFEDRPMTADPEDLTPSPEDARIMRARIDELERTAKIFCGQVEAYWPTWAKHIIEQRRAEITGITLTDV